MYVSILADCVSEENFGMFLPVVGFIGAGRMAKAMANGFIASGLLKPANIIASDIDSNILKFIGDLGACITHDNLEVVQKASCIIIAVKPHIVADVLAEISPVINKSKLLVSVAAGITVNTIEKRLPEGTRVVRVMPNTPVLVQAGASMTSPGTALQEGDIPLVSCLFKSVGICENGNESLIDAASGVSGSGPAYAFVAIEALADGGVKMGLPRDLATRLAAQTLLGAAKMVLETGKHPGQLKDEVCSPGGSTIAAIHRLEKAGFRGALIDAVETATLKAKDLGKI